MELSKARIAMSPTEQTAYFALLRAGKVVATPSVLAGLLEISFVRATKILFQLRKRGAARKIGKGKYVILAPEVLQGTGRFVQDPLIVTSQLMEILKQQYAVAYLSAAYLHGLLEQLPQVGQVMVTKRRPSIRLSETQAVEFVTVVTWKFFGIIQTRHGGGAVAVTDVEKTVVDCLDRLDFTGGVEEAGRIVLRAAERMDPRKLVRYAKALRSIPLLQRLGCILERGGLFPEAVKALLPRKNAVVRLLEPTAPREGRLSPKWRLIENVELDLGER